MRFSPRAAPDRRTAPSASKIDALGLQTFDASQWPAPMTFDLGQGRLGDWIDLVGLTVGKRLAMPYKTILMHCNITVVLGNFFRRHSRLPTGSNHT